MRKIVPFLPILLLAQGVGISAADAAAFELREFSATAMGTSYAGAGVNVNDPASLFYNPATLSGVNDWDISVNGAGLLLNSSGNFTGTTQAGTPTGGKTNPHEFISDAFLPAIALRYRLNDRWAIGLTATVPFGESTHYPANWTGRYYAQTSVVTDYNFTPMISWQATPELTLAGGMQIDYVHAYLSQAIDFGTIGAGAGIPGAVPGAMDGRAKVKGNDWQTGFVLGALWKPDPAWSFGLSYKSEMRQNLSGHETFQYDTAGIGQTINALTGAFADSRGSARLPLPWQADASARYDVNNQWSLLAGLEYTGWSGFHYLAVTSANPANPASLTVTDWRNTWFGSLGAEYRPDDRWTLRVGTAYDQAAIPKAHLEPRIPGADRYWLSAGVGYKWNEHTEINLAYDHLFTPHSTVRQSSADPANAATVRGGLDGVSNTNANLVGLQVTYRE